MLAVNCPEWAWELASAWASGLAWVWASGLAWALGSVREWARSRCCTRRRSGKPKREAGCGAWGKDYWREVTATSLSQLLCTVAGRVAGPCRKATPRLQVAIFVGAIPALGCSRISTRHIPATQQCKRRHDKNEGVEPQAGRWLWRSRKTPRESSSSEVGAQWFRVGIRRGKTRDAHLSSNGPTGRRQSQSPQRLSGRLGKYWRDGRQTCKLTTSVCSSVT